MEKLWKNGHVRYLSLMALGVALFIVPAAVWGDTLNWDTPYGNFNLNLTASQAVLGYDGILKQAIGGVSLPIYTDPKGIITLQAGAVAPWPTNGATVEPLLMAGHDILKEIPGLNQFQNISLNIFARYATSVGKAGAGVAFSYAFAGGTTAPTPAPAPSSSVTPQ